MKERKERKVRASLKMSYELRFNSILLVTAGGGDVWFRVDGTIVYIPARTESKG